VEEPSLSDPGRDNLVPMNATAAATTLPPAASPRARLRAAGTLALLGASLGTAFDYAHVRTGAIEYPVASVLGVPLWVPGLYASSALAIGLSHPLLDRSLGRAERVPLTPFRVAFGLVALCGIWFATGALPFDSLTTTLLLSPVSLAVVYAFDRTWVGVLLAIATAVTAVGVEILLSHLGLFRHTHGDVLGVALWLPCIYVAASVAVGNTGRWLLAPTRIATN